LSSTIISARTACMTTRRQESSALINQDSLNMIVAEAALGTTIPHVCMRAKVCKRRATNNDA
jgi:hypothetical protein